MGVVQTGHCSGKDRPSCKHERQYRIGTGLGAWNLAPEVKAWRCLCVVLPQTSGLPVAALQDSPCCRAYLDVLPYSFSFSYHLSLSKVFTHNPRATWIQRNIVARLENVMWCRLYTINQGSVPVLKPGNVFFRSLGNNLLEYFLNLSISLSIYIFLPC